MAGASGGRRVQRLAGQLGAPARALVEPRGGCRRAVDMPGRPPGPPGFARGGLVGGGGVQDEVEGAPVRDSAVDLLEEGEARPGPGAARALAADRAGGAVERRAPRGGGRGACRQGVPLREAGPQRPARRGAGAGLALALLVAAAHQRARRRREGEADDGADLGHAGRIGRAAGTAQPGAAAGPRRPRGAGAPWAPAPPPAPSSAATSGSRPQASR